MLTAETFSQQRYIAYLTAGVYDTLAIAEAMIAGGVDILEIGIPYSDPIMDGPVIQTAMQQALTAGMTPLAVLALCHEIKHRFAIPIVLFTYYNPIKQLGEKFYQEAARANIDAVLIVDLPLEEQATHHAYLRQSHLAHVQLLAPNTSAQRVKAMMATQPAFCYYACRAGITGVQQALPHGFAERIAQIRAQGTTPVVAGFGISNAEMARECLQHCDGFVVGSCLVQAVLQQKSLGEITELTRSIDPRQR